MNNSLPWQAMKLELYSELARGQTGGTEMKAVYPYTVHLNINVKGADYRSQHRLLHILTGFTAGQIALSWLITDGTQRSTLDSYSQADVYRIFTCTVMNK